MQKNSKLRQFGEYDKLGVCIPCYQETKFDIKKFLSQQLQINNIQLLDSQSIGKLIVPDDNGYPILEENSKVSDEIIRCLPVNSYDIEISNQGIVKFHYAEGVV